MRLRKSKKRSLIGNVMQRVGHEHAVEHAEGPGERREITDVRDDVDTAVAPGYLFEGSAIEIDRVDDALGRQERRERERERPITGAKVGPRLRTVARQRRMRNEGPGIGRRQRPRVDNASGLLITRSVADPLNRPADKGIVRVMQLRAARLCLDCEELHIADVCPICASERYAFLSTWLPSEERRKWRRGQPPAQEPVPQGVRAWLRTIVRWLDGEATADRPALRRRASDHVPRLDFEERPREAQPSQSLEPQPVHTSRKTDRWMGSIDD